MELLLETLLVIIVKPDPSIFISFFPALHNIHIWPIGHKMKDLSKWFCVSKNMTFINNGGGLKYTFIT